MRCRFLALFTTLTLCFGAGLANAADEPALLLRIQSIDKLLLKANFLAKKANLEEQANQFLGFIEALKGETGLEGIDTARTWGVTVNIGQNITSPKVVVMLPIKDQNAFLNLFGRFGIAPEKGESGVYSLELPNLPQSGYFKFVDQFVYLTALDPNNLRDLPNAKQLLAIEDAGVVLDLTYNLEAVPTEVKNLLYGQLEMGLAQAKEEPEETELEQAAKTATLDYIAKGIKIFLNQGKMGKYELRVDESAEEITYTESFQAKDGSELKNAIASLGNLRSSNIPTIQKRAPIANLGIVAALPTEIRQKFAPFLKQEIAKELEKAPAAQRAVLNPLVEGILPTLQAGELDLGVGLAGPDTDGKYTVMASLKVVNGPGIENGIKKAVPLLPPRVQGVFQLDAAMADGVALHKIMPPPQAYTLQVNKLFGQNPIYAAFQQDRAILTFGSNSEKMVRELLQASPGTVPVVSARASIAKLAMMVQPGRTQTIRTAAQNAFGGLDSRNDVVRYSFTGGDKLQSRIVVKADIIPFVVELVGKLGSSPDDLPFQPEDPPSAP